MGYFLYYFTVVASFFLILVISLSISSFLYLLSEVCEEYPFKVKYIIQNIFIVLLILHVLLLADDFSRIYSRIFLSLICLCLYYISFQKYPFIKIISLESMLSAIAFILSNITWFNYFSSNIYDFNFFQIVGFMLIIVWLIPLLLFISLTISDTLPTSNMHISEESVGNLNRDKSFFKMIYDNAVQSLEKIMSINLSSNSRNTKKK